ncbi:synapse differentiation-inducing gene protein 1-like [Sinocyclocheilus rhinocerous]|uniref:synapse differentiation-inducing gene protein 1-like n=1 Tax=Sinocyclocheilus rhinocerous TaxID=307959 RepID=UPI0007B95247|nr:PREDICTED: synapse differentiation-inducing gene protein 1-like [Sinocyclocheilus rhinocerous]
MEPQEDWNTSEKSKLLQPGPPPYQDHQPPPGNFQSTSGYQAQQYGASGPYGQGPYPGHAAVIVQPAVYVTTTPLVYPMPDYLGYSIFTMLCCCLPLGITALVFSINTRNANMSGQQQLAERNSKLAFTLNNTALGIGIVFLVLYVTLIIVNSKNHSNP